MRKQELQQKLSNPKKIGEISKQANISISTLHYYEKIGLLETPIRSRNGYRLYDQNALGRLDFIKKSKTLGFKLDEIRQVIDESKTVGCPCESVRTIVYERLREADEKIEEMKRFRNDLSEVVKGWDKIKNSEAVICELIEQAGKDF